MFVPINVHAKYQSEDVLLHLHAFLLSLHTFLAFCRVHSACAEYPQLLAEYPHLRRIPSVPNTLSSCLFNDIFFFYMRLRSRRYEVSIYSCTSSDLGRGILESKTSNTVGPSCAEEALQTHHATVDYEGTHEAKAHFHSNSSTRGN